MNPAGATDWQALRPGETAGPAPEARDAGLVFIGRLRTPFLARDDCPRQGDPDSGPDCRVEIDAAWRPALAGIEAHAHLDLLYWMHAARRDLLTQTPRGGAPVGTFALRSPARPNPIAVSRVRLLRVEDGALVVRGLDCLDGTPLLDVKPHRRAHASSGLPASARDSSLPPRGEGMGMGGVQPGERSPSGTTPTPIPSPQGGGEASRHGSRSR